MTEQAVISDRPRQGWRTAFGLLWVSQGAAVTSEQIGELAIPLLAVLALHASAIDLGLLGAARWLPFLLLALPLGVLVDRRRRRPLIVIADWARAGLSLAAGLLALAGILTIPQLLLLAVLIGCGNVLFEVAYQSVLPGIVPADRLASANARLQATASVAQTGGPGLGGVLVQLLTAQWAIVANALSYAVSAVAIGAIRTPEPALPPRRRGFIADVRDGVRHVVRDPYLLGNLGFSALYNPFSQWIAVLFALHAVRTLEMSPAELGVVLALGGLGAFAGSVISDAAARRFGAGRTLMWCAASECAVFLALPLPDAGWPNAAVLIACGAVFAINGVGVAMSSVILVTIRQLRTPHGLLGRVNAGMRTVSYGTVALGAAAGGLVGELVGTRTGLAIGAVLILGTVIWVALSPLPRVVDVRSLATAAAADGMHD